jgi:hypothetical protein
MEENTGHIPDSQPNGKSHYATIPVTHILQAFLSSVNKEAVAVTGEQKHTFPKNYLTVDPLFPVHS